MKNNKKLLILLICISLLASIFFITEIYGKYISSAKGNASIAISKWAISVNNNSIKNSTNISNSIVPVFPGNDHIASNIIAPSAKGYFDLSLDFTNVDVSFKYEISLSANTESAVSDIVATGYSMDNGQTINFEDYNENITDTILYNSDINKRDIRVYIMWNDDPSTSNMDNNSDTISTISEDNLALFDVNISFTQVTNN